MFQVEALSEIHLAWTFSLCLVSQIYKFAIDFLNKTR